ncbi:transcriptional regulator, TetR family [Chloroherpeton thalassium ATCC 35110]|uniref:Transcriptional regulator, TetR family n=1 Tax=Chloroherpeton thalassium (strain ATCC 35110 / GB-78) TaxID=517418 RepID=B3QWX1_CHLT3|nr:TetR/AcrR family transcriptional regulator [Chloroherpeton thalassium]ACF13335.1 transcriptional regulator, TetR family [Chloroherpeton thalassium ATCC 35110]
MNEEGKFNRILRHARTRFFQDGISCVTIEGLAKELGIAPEAISTHFKSKDELLNKVVDDYVKDLSNQLDEIQSKPADFLDRVNELWVFAGKTFAAAGHDFKESIRANYPKHWERLNAFYRERLLPVLSDQMKQGVRMAVFRSDLNIEVALMLFQNGIEQIATPVVLAKNSYSTEDAIKSILQLIFDGSLADHTRTVFRRYAARVPRKNVVFKRVVLETHS